MDFRNDKITILDLVNFIKKDKVKLKHRYPVKQRVKINQSLFIESVLIGIPINSIYFISDKDGWFLIDGLERLKAIYDFFQGKFKLENLVYLDRYKGLSYSELPRAIQRKLEDTFIQCYILRSENESMNKSIFKRLQNKEYEE